MTTTKPCIIRWRTGYRHYVVYNDHGREILNRPTYCQAADAASGYGYTVLPPNSKHHQGLLSQIEHLRGVGLR